jgi:hypothetical protein
MPQPRPLDTRLARVEDRRAAAATETSVGAARQRRLLRAEAAIGSLVHEALARRGVDPAAVARLKLADDAAAALAALSDTPELARADREALPPVTARERASADVFAAKIIGMTRGFAAAPPPDFASASLAEFFAWSLAVAARGRAGPTPPGEEAE